MSTGLRDASDPVPDDSPVLDALEQYAQYVEELYDVKRTNPIFVETNTEKLAIRSIGRTIRKWNHAFDPQSPPRTLIVRLAERLPSLFIEVIDEPKKILQRRRAMESIHRVKELDSNCVQWLTRQPGNTIEQKCGHRQTILSVQRYQSHDTLENRVVRDLLRKCESLAISYLRQYEEKFRNHPSIHKITEFRRLCRRLSLLPHLTEISGLSRLPKPNYVLLNESRYRRIWKAYLEVTRQQYRRQQLWRWRHDVYAEMLVIAWMSSGSRLMVEKHLRPAAHRFDMRIRDTAINGRHFDWLAYPPIWRINCRSRFYVGTTESIRLLPVPEASNFTLQGGFSIATWNGSEFLVSQLRVKFPEDKYLGDTLDTPPVVIELLDPEGNSRFGSQGNQLRVPLRLIEHPNALDALMNSWCL